MRSVPSTTTSLLAFVYIFTVTSAVLRAEDNKPGGRQPLADGESGILVLEDGGVLKGQVTRAVDWYMVARGGGQMQIPVSRVLVVCRTLEEAYEFRRQQISGDKPADHLRLAEWCIRYELRAEAGRELVEARRLDPDIPRLAVLERRLEKSGERPVAQQSVYLAAASPKAKPQAAGVPAHATSKASDLPAGVIEHFTRKVQPVLVNNCTMSGCHQQGGKQSFQLDRALLRGESNRRSTMHNLEAALALVDRNHPEQSALLTVPRRTHGGTTGPVFGPRQDQAFKHLVDWVALVAPTKEATTPAADASAESADATSALENQPATNAVGISTDDSRPQARRRAAIQAAAAISAEADPALKTPQRLQHGVQLQSWRPRDAFDPEIFNRGQRARATAGPSANQLPNDPAASTAEKR